MICTSYVPILHYSDTYFFPEFVFYMSFSIFYLKIANESCEFRNYLKILIINKTTVLLFSSLNNVHLHNQIIQYLFSKSTPLLLMRPQQTLRHLLLCIHIGCHSNIKFSLFSFSNSNSYGLSLPSLPPCLMIYRCKEKLTGCLFLTSIILRRSMDEVVPQRIDL